MEKRFYKATLSLREKRADGPADSLGVLTGYISVFNSDSYDLGGFTEQVKPGAFAETLKSEDVVCLVNHDHSVVMGRLSAGTLRLEEDATGLRFEDDIPDTTAGRDLVVSVRRKDLEGCSFGFEVLEDTWTNQEDGTAFCELTKVRLWEVSVGVTFPAYPETSMSLRDRFKARQKRTRQQYRARLAVMKLA